jgi:hypothetical protein
MKLPEEEQPGSTREHQERFIELVRLGSSSPFNLNPLLCATPRWIIDREGASPQRLERSSSLLHHLLVRQSSRNELQNCLAAPGIGLDLPTRPLAIRQYGPSNSFELRPSTQKPTRLSQGPTAVLRPAAKVLYHHASSTRSELLPLHGHATPPRAISVRVCVGRQSRTPTRSSSSSSWRDDWHLRPIFSLFSALWYVDIGIRKVPRGKR